VVEQEVELNWPERAKKKERNVKERHPSRRRRSKLESRD